MHIYKVTLVGTEASADHEYTNISLYLLTQDSVFMFSGAQVRLIDDVIMRTRTRQWHAWECTLS